MKLLQKRPVAAGIMVLAVLAAVLIGQARKPAPFPLGTTVPEGQPRLRLISA